MSGLLSIIFEYAPYILGSVAIIVAIVLFAIRNAEECPLPDRRLQLQRFLLKGLQPENPNPH